MPDITEGISKYFIALMKINSEDIAERLIQEKIKELVNFQIDDAINIVKSQRGEWGEFAVRANVVSNAIIEDITVKLSAQKML